ncbi:MAG: hypothetical protein AMJ68_00710 [Acidithiobacillales bacterium SG8_45]|jgi:hypothetical protein|nr:MAG: hypothetical protein AMJ68_00710 [Acidithiobacillales bacterium SG8_45]
MIRIKKIVFDVLKPHRPTGLEFASAIAERCPGSVVNLNVEAVDQNTESVLLRVEGESLDFDTISNTILELGGSIHSVDEVEVIHLPDSSVAE